MILIWSEEKLPFFFIKSVELSENTSSDEDQTNCVCVCVYIHMQILKMRLKWVKLDSCDSAFSWSATSNQIKPSLKSFCEFDVCQRAETLQIWTYSSYSIMFSAITITCILFLPFLTLTSRDPDSSFLSSTTEAKKSQVESEGNEVMRGSQGSSSGSRNRIVMFTSWRAEAAVRLTCVRPVDVFWELALIPVCISLSCKTRETQETVRKHTEE